MRAAGTVFSGSDMSESVPAIPWRIGVPGWVIEDGRYPEFEVGHRVEFALEFSGATGTAKVGDPDFARPLGGDRYAIHGHIVHASEYAWAVDFGLIAFADEPAPPWAVPGSAASGEVYLRVNCSFDIEGLVAVLPDAKPIYGWSIERICVASETGTGTGAAESRAPQYVHRTEALLPRGEMVSYILECRLLN